MNSAVPQWSLALHGNILSLNSIKFQLSNCQRHRQREERCCILLPMNQSREIWCLTLCIYKQSHKYLSYVTKAPNCIKTAAVESRDLWFAKWKVTVDQLWFSLFIYLGPHLIFVSPWNCLFRACLSDQSDWRCESSSASSSFYKQENRPNNDECSKII